MVAHAKVMAQIGTQKEEQKVPSQLVRMDSLNSLIELSNQAGKNRVVEVLKVDSTLPTNRIRTSKYCWWDFVPKNFLQQFSKLPNIYFLVIGILQAIPQTSNTDGVPTIYIPLGIILFATAIKDLYEDYHRSVSDNAENSQVVTQVTPTGLLQIPSEQIRVGMCVLIKNGDNIPCDGYLLHTPGQFAYVETKNLDGQTNFKRKNVSPLVRELFHYESQSCVWEKILFRSQSPNPNLLSFSGVVNGKESIHLNNFLYRSSKLRNTEEVVMLAAYTGHETKILQNMNKPVQKKTGLTTKLGYTTLGMFALVLLASIIIALLRPAKSTDRTGRVEILFRVCSRWILNLTNLVPISLIVTLEIIKLLQGKLMERDPKLKSHGIEPIVNASGVLQDLGSIEYIASDKTGTLTKNNLVFRQITDGNIVFHKLDDIPKQLLKPLALCHQTFISPTGQFQGVSQDQICIVEFCRNYEVEMTARSPTKMKYQLDKDGPKTEVDVLKVIQFSSDRKRQSVILKQGNRIYIYCKGADDVMMSRIKDSTRKRKVYEQIDNLARLGRRTLVFTYKALSAQYAQIWINLHNTETIKNQKIQMEELQQQMETDLQIVCGTGIEDQLQEEVPETLRYLVTAGIKIVVISGDKPETVMSIAQNLDIGLKPFLAVTKEYTDVLQNQDLVVFARCTPKEKSAIVKAIKKKGRVLAIGDGANDVAMLTEANIGVGIKGKEGMAASQAADIGISQFRHLRRLVLYYGVQISRKNSVLIEYNFYKNFLFTFPQLIFGYYSSFSGVYLYEPYISQIFNLLYTSLPIMVFALFDVNQNDDKLTRNEGNIYQETQIVDSFNFTSFVLSLVEAFGQSIIASFFCFTLLSELFISPGDLTMYEASCVLILFVILLSNQKLFVLARHLTTGFLTSLVIGIICFFGSVAIIRFFSTNLGEYSEFINTRTVIVTILCYVTAQLAHYVAEVVYTVMNALRRKLHRALAQRRGIVKVESNTMDHLEDIIKE